MASGIGEADPERGLGGWEAVGRGRRRRTAVGGKPGADHALFLTLGMME